MAVLDHRGIQTVPYVSFDREAEKNALRRCADAVEKDKRLAAFEITLAFRCLRRLIE